MRAVATGWTSPRHPPGALSCPDPAARGRAGIASTARQAGEGHKRIDSTVSVRALPGGIFFEEHMKAHKIDEPLGVNRYIERSFKGLPRCIQEAIAANLQAYVKFESAAKPYGKLTRHDGLDALLYAEEYAHR